MSVLLRQNTTINSSYKACNQASVAFRTKKQPPSKRHWKPALDRKDEATIVFKAIVHLPSNDTSIDLHGLAWKRELQYRTTRGSQYHRGGVTVSQRWVTVPHR